MSNLAERVTQANETAQKLGLPPVLPTREQQAHKLWADSCIELQRIEKTLAPAFERHQKALDACAEYGSENRLRMNPYMQEAWSVWSAKQLAAAERAKGK
jgi:hypothetical protein